VRQVASRMLDLLGCQVLEAADGAEALELAEQRGSSIQIVVTDVVMPCMTGPELVKRLRVSRGQREERRVADSRPLSPLERRRDRPSPAAVVPATPNVRLAAYLETAPSLSRRLARRLRATAA